ncbi:putative internal virion protein C [Erwinia phage pEp_SNUABM_04]|nr:putative internal virion protein C [Erwinia phage pEp_SNUABM_04]
MSKLSESLGSIAQPGISRLRGGGGSAFNYQQSTVGEDPKYARQSALIGTVGKLAEMGADAYQQFDAKKRAKADERSDEIIRKLTPEQRRQAIKDGTLLYKDDPYAMQALKVKTGRNAAFLADDEVNQKILNGDFRTREEMEKFRHERLQATAKQFATDFGIDETDEFYQKGFNSNITERNVQLYGSHDTFLSDQAKKGNVVNSRIELQGALQDPAVLKSKNAGTFFENYINNGLRNNTIPSDEQAMQIISSSISDTMQRDGGAAFLQDIENRKVTLHGTTSTYRELMGEEQWNAMMVKAQQTQFNNDAKLTERFRLGATSATLQEDTSKGWEMIQGLKGELDALQPGEQMTAQRELLIQAEENLKARFKQESAQTAKAMDDAKKTTNKNAVIEKQFAKRLNGQYVSTDYKDMPTNENTGEFKHSDMVNYANGKLAEIDSMDISDAAKDREKLRYLRADSKEGAFRTAIGTMVTDASSEWQAAVMNGKMPEDTTAMDNLRRLRNADPNTIAALYPEQAELFLTMDMMDKYGLDPQVMIDADKARMSKTKEQDIEDSKAFESMLNDSKVPEISRIPANLREMARKQYDSFKYRTGNADGAAQVVAQFLKDSTATFQSGDLDGKTFGIVSRNALQTTDDPRSWEQGRDILNEAVKAHIKQNPWITSDQLSVYEQGDSIYLMDTTGSYRIRYDREILQKEYAQTQQRAQEAAEKKALEEFAKANRRAPIAAAGQARKAAGERARKKRESVPKFIYGRKDE